MEELTPAEDVAASVLFPESIYGIGGPVEVGGAEGGNSIMNHASG